MIKKNIKFEIKKYFMQNPSAKLRIRQVEKTLNLSLPSVIRYLNNLVEENILRKELIGNITFFTSNFDSNEYKLEKKLFNLKLIYESKLIEYLKINFSNPNIVLFGSFLYGEDLEESDIDIFIQTPIKTKIQLPENFQKLLKRQIQIFQFKDIFKIENIELRNNIINGYLINGYIEVFKNER